jgi:hypothetical protein
MQKGSLSSVFTDRANPIQPHVETMMALRQVYTYVHATRARDSDPENFSLSAVKKCPVFAFVF